MISAIVITHNEERNIERCLNSIRWADEIVVVDSFSTDRTIELARAFTTIVVQHQYENDIKQREKGFSAAKGEWLLWIDADEEVTAELSDEIKRITGSSDAADGYEIPRMADVLGASIKHGGWYPDWQFRLARRETLIPEYQEVHGGFTTSGLRAKLTGILRHYTYPTVAELTRKINEHSSLHVSNKLRESAGGNAGIRKIVLSPLAQFFKMYMFKQGYKDGTQGFLLAAYSAWYTFLLYAKLREFRNDAGLGRPPAPITNREIYDRKTVAGTSRDAIYDRVVRSNGESSLQATTRKHLSSFVGFVVVPPLKFAAGYFGKALFSHGVRGIVEAALPALEVFTINAKIWELRRSA